MQNELNPGEIFITMQGQTGNIHYEEDFSHGADTNLYGLGTMSETKHLKV